jgi:hypothetical protein
MFNYNATWHGSACDIKNFLKSAFFIIQNVIVFTCYCAKRVSEITYTLKPSVKQLHNKYCQLAFTLSAYQCDGNLLDNTSLKQSFSSAGYSASGHHLTLANQLPTQISSPAEFSNFVSLFDLTAFSLILIWFVVTILCIILIKSYSKPGFLLNKKIALQFKDNLQHIQVMNALNETRRYITLFIVLYNILSIGLLASLWYAFKQTVKYFGL